MLVLVLLVLLLQQLLLILTGSRASRCCGRPIWGNKSHNCDAYVNELICIPIACVIHLYFVKASSNSSSLSDANPWVVMQRRLA
jgi:hypothetical protein